ncbi:MAG: diaminopimelate epimerase, partial [Desulfobacteraceae bacterium]
MTIEFMKMHGAGNDFVVIDDRNGETAKKISYPDLAKRLCSRHFGIGADGLLLVLNSETHDIRFRIFNSDGSEAGMCGNGIRCFASYLVAQKIVSTRIIRVETPAGTVVPEVLESDEKGIRRVRVDMGEPLFDPGAIPFVCHASRALDQVIVAEGRKVAVTAVATGNPNAVVFVDDVETVDLAKQGRAIETHDRFPERANVVFI